jgi:hypothetical protein
VSHRSAQPTSDRTGAPGGAVALRLLAALVVLAAGIAAVVIAVLLVQSVLST